MQKLWMTSLGALLALVMVLSACGPAADNASPASQETPPDAAASSSQEGSTLTPPGEFPIVEETATISIFTPLYASVEDMATNLFTEELEAITNVHIDWQLAPQANFTEKRNLVLASGNYPDAFLNPGFNNTELLIYSSQGVLIPLNDLIEGQMVYFKQYLPTRPGLEEALTAPDGNIYSLGNDQLCFHCKVTNKMWINQSWIDNLGLTMPSTTEEFYQVLQAFKTGDPNGNGLADEIPLVAQAPDQGNSHLTTFLMNAFIYDDGVNHFITEQGRVGVAYNREEWREGIRYFKRLYDEELLDPTSFTLTSDQVRTLAEKGDQAEVGAVPQLHVGAFQNLTAERYLEYTTVPPLQGPEGNRTCAWNYYNGSYNVFVITSSCETPEIAARWADYIYSKPEASIRARIGRQGEEWDYADDGEKGLHGGQAVWKKLTALGTPTQNYYWSGEFTAVFDHSEQTGGANDYEYMLYDNNLNYEPYKPEESMVMPPIWLDNTVADQAAQYATELRDYVNESFAQFVTGNRDIESGWDSYLQELDVIGLEEFLRIYQTAYDSLA